MKKYLFTVRIIGVGKDEDSAWGDAIDSFGSYNEPLPEPKDIEELEWEEDEEND